MTSSFRHYEPSYKGLKPKKSKLSIQEYLNYEPSYKGLKRWEEDLPWFQYQITNLPIRD